MNEPESLIAVIEFRRPCNEMDKAERESIYNCLTALAGRLYDPHSSTSKVYLHRKVEQNNLTEFFDL